MKVAACCIESFMGWECLVARHDVPKLDDVDASDDGQDFCVQLIELKA
jgi:hypothetical protein